MSEEKKELNKEKLEKVAGGFTWVNHKYYISIQYSVNGYGTTEILGPYDDRPQALNAGLLAATIMYDQGCRNISYTDIYSDAYENFVGEKHCYPAQGYDK